MTENVHTCKCGEGIHSYNSYDVDFFEKYGVCKSCYHKSKGLIKVGNHYVPWEYRNHAELTGDTPAIPEHYEDVYAALPTIEWCKERMKWKVTFAAADIGGYDVCTIEWYFDSKEDIIQEMMEETVNEED